MSHENQTDAYSSPRLRRASAFSWISLFETLVLTAALLLLAQIASPLTAPLAQARLEHHFAQASVLDQRSVWLAGHLAQVLAVHAALLWMSMRLARGAGNSIAIAVAIGAGWAAALSWLVASEATMWLAATTALALVAMPALPRRVRTQSPSHALLVPGWFFLVSLGLIWLTDYGSYVQPARSRHLAYSHALAITAAHAVFAFTALFRGLLCAASIRCLARVDTAIAAATATARPAAVWRVFVLPAIYLVWAVSIAAMFGARRPALTSELLRIPLYLLTGWVLYRWSASRTPRRAWVAGAAVLIALSAGMVGTQDLGQLFLMGMATALAVSLGALSATGRWRSAGVLALVMAIGATVAGVRALDAYCDTNPKRHFCQREQARSLQFEGPVQYLSELRWLAADTPAGGFGLTRVPYCGTLGSLAPGQYACGGPPRELHSDYVLAALMALWGAPMALALTAGCALLLASLPVPGPRHDATHPSHFAFWVLCAFSTVSIGQLLLTSLGTLGVLPLTGITFPLLALGSSALLTSAAFCGLGANRESTGSAPDAPRS